MGCCRDNPSPDVLLYQQIVQITQSLEGKAEDWVHPVKGPKLKRLQAVLTKIEAYHVRSPRETQESE